ncbi:hypothetical protein SAMN05877831_10884 [Rhodobacter maris]|uniref:Lipoprotein n=1 Tax=Rhodobacter maris TaxID=446682 RepID=A0A285SQN7_9RHOB|nr:hypothetical protein SAMN05877831_10884 [Rhodobacter maris]
MSKKAFAALALLAFVAACAPKPAPVEPVTVEPVQTGKYK